MKALRALLLCSVLLAAGQAAALDPFEIQVYDGSADRRGEAGLEVHVNGVLRGLKTAVYPELPPDHQWHLTLEPSYGVTDYWELGGYLQTALLPDGTADYAGAKLRSKFVLPAPELRLGVNFELSLLPARYEAGRWGGEIRPIVGWETDRFIVVTNPILSLSLTGGEVDFEPCGMAKVKLGPVALGVEYYAGLGALLSPEAAGLQQHYVFEALDLLSVPRFELNAAVGEGLTRSSNALIAKMIVGYTF